MNSRADNLDRRVRILLVDDDEEDRLITHLLLAENGAGWFDLDWVASYDAGLETMQRNEHDVYLLDYDLGGREGVELLREAIDRGCHGPLILLTGQRDHDVDVLAMKAGAVDYLAKGRIDAALLERAVRYAVERNLLQRQREELIRKLKKALAEIKTLGGLLPICSSCKKIRDDTGYWNQIETYLRDHSEVEFSHSLCPPVSGFCTLSTTKRRPQGTRWKIAEGKRICPPASRPPRSSAPLSHGPTPARRLRAPRVSEAPPRHGWTNDRTCYRLSSATICGRRHELPATNRPRPQGIRA